VQVGPRRSEKEEGLDEGSERKKVQQFGDSKTWYFSFYTNISQSPIPGIPFLPYHLYPDMVINHSI
jgi:hypothetical protein